MERNPIYQQLTRNLRWKTKDAFRWLTGWITLIGSVVLLGVAIFAGNYGWGMWLTVGLTLLMVAVILLAPVITLITTALLTGKHAGHDMLVLVQLSGVYPRQIVDGYEAAVRQHLLWLRAIGLGVIVPIWLIMLYAMGGFAVIACLQAAACVAVDALQSVFNAFMMSAVSISLLVSIGINLSELGLIVGIWLGLTQRQNSLLGAAGVIGGALLVCIILYSFVFLAPFGICASFLILPLIIFGAPALSKNIRRRTLDAVNDIHSVPESL